MLVALLFLVTAASPALAAERQVETDTSTITTRTVVVPAPAVAELPDGTLRGVTSVLEVTVRNGTGDVFMDTRPLAQLDMQGSARLAAATAASIAGVPFDQHDHFVTMRAAAPIVGGPSAGGTMAVAFTALLAGWPLRDDVLMTGMINPDGTIGPVGGILEKAEAAHEAGASLFLVPEGQAIVVRQVHEVHEEGGFQEVRTRQEEVDVRQYAADKWDLEVREVADVQAAVENFTGVRIVRETPKGDLDHPLFEEVMGEASRDQLRDARAELARVETELDAAGLAEAGRPQTEESLRGLLDRVRTRLDRADAAVGEKGFYTASSLVFQSRIDLRKADIVLRAFAADDQSTFLIGFRDTLEAELEEARKEAADTTPQTVTGLEAVGAAQVRVMEAKDLLAAADGALEAGDVPDAIDRLAFAEERRRSVVWWLGLAEELDEIGAGATLEAPPDRLARDTLTAALQAVGYAEVLIGQTGAGTLSSALLAEAGQDLESALEAGRLGLQVGSMYLSLEAQVGAHAALSLVGSDALLADRVERSRDRALLEIERSRGAGVEPVLAVSYVDFASSLVDSSPVDALVLYGFAATVARTSTLLTGVGPCGLSGDCGAQVVLPENEPEPLWSGPEAAVVAVGMIAFVGGATAGVLAVRGRDADRTTQHDSHSATGPVVRPLRPRRMVALPEGRHHNGAATQRTHQGAILAGRRARP